MILGGVLTQYLSWRYTLFVNLIFAAIAVAGALAYIRSSRPATPPRMDWPGAVLACAGLFLIVFEGDARGPDLLLASDRPKHLALRDRVYEYGAGQYLVASVDLPVTGHVTGAAPGRPRSVSG